MKINFLNSYGNTIDHIIFHSIAYATVDKREEDYALDNGWMKMPYFPNKNITNKENIWLQIRLSRINLKKFKWKADDRRIFKKFKKDYSYEVKNVNEITPKERRQLKDIYFKYIKKKSFLKTPSLEDTKAYEYEFKYFFLDSDNKKIVLHYFKSKLIAFAIIEEFEKSIMGIQFAWDYERPHLRIGIMQNNIIADLYKSKNIDYYYLGMSYGKECVYKNRYYGFEFWTGKEWKTNKLEYRKMCIKDSMIKNFEDLELLNDYYIYE